MDLPGDVSREAFRTMMRDLADAGYWREADERRTDGFVALLAAFRRMAEDAAKQRARPTATSGRETALSFLKATVEDPNKPMTERMGAASLLLVHSAEEK